jgi:predicted nucleotide-binding protein (sugar kinase/HSP70/actin superfamily)
MNINAPRVGSMQFMAKDFCERAGLGYVDSPPYSERTVELGVSVSPEHLCFPMKILLGSAIEALEDGADTLVTVAGFGPCRFNYFGEIQKRILKREGFEFEIVVFDGPRDAPVSFYRNVRRVLSGSPLGPVRFLRLLPLTVLKGRCYDEIEKQAMALRALEVEAGSVDRAAEECLSMLLPAQSRDEVEEVRCAVAERFQTVEVDKARLHLRVGLIGELMTCIEPYFNFDAPRWLAKKGAVVERSLHMSDIFTPMGRNPVFGADDREIGLAARPFVCHGIGGHGQINVAAAAMFARRGFDALVHFAPFACLPEVIARTVFSRISNEFDIPVLSISVDEQTGREGIQTRMEALTDLAWSRYRERVNAEERESVKA